MNKILFVFIAFSLSFSFDSVSRISSCQAEEPAAKYLQALRDNGFYDVAIDYLTRAADSDLISEEFKRILPYEKAETLIESTAQIRDIKQWEPRLDEAEKLLNEYAAAEKDPEAAARVVQFQGNLQYKRARIYMLQSDSDRLTADEKSALKLKSREKLTQALEKYKQARAAIRSAIDNFQIDPEDPMSESNLKKMRGSYTQVRVRLPLVAEQLADTHPAGSAENAKILKEALTEYLDLWKKYSGYRAGLDACLFSGRCHQKMNQHPQAIAQFEEIFKLGNSSAIKALKKKAMILATESWDKVEPYPHERIVQFLSPTVATLNRQDDRDPNWLRIKLELAKALHIKADIVKKEKRTGSSGEANDLNRLASKYAKSVARSKNPHQQLAQKWLADWNLKFTASKTDADDKPPASFDEARQRGKDRIADIENSMREYLDAKKSGDAAEIESTQAQLIAEADAALASLNDALAMADKETPRADINNVRYLQSYSYFAKERYLESAIIGEFLLQKYPTVDWSKQATSLAIKSYAKLTESAEGPEKEFYQGRLQRAGESMVNRWPGSAEATSAAIRMTSQAISSNDFENAERYYKLLPEGSAAQQGLGAQLGQKMWDRYSKQKSSDPTNPQLPDYFAKAKAQLIKAVDVNSIDDVDYSTAISGLFLVEAYLEAGEVTSAVAQLESAIVSPIELVKANHKSIQNPRINKVYKFATFKTTIKAYLAAMKESSDPQNEIEKVNLIIKAMSELAKGDPTDQRQVTRVYATIAKDLKEQFDLQPSIEQKTSFASTVMTFFGQIGRGSSDTTTLFWASDSLLDMSEALRAENAKEKSQELSTLAVELLRVAEQSGVEDASKMKYQRLLALAERGSGNYQSSVDKFAELLKERNGLNLQIDAAKTLHNWGLGEQKSDQLAKAMMGTAPTVDPKNKRKVNVIWGWRKLVQQTRGNEKFQNQYRECLYYSVECRFRYGQMEKSNKAMTSARNELDKALSRYTFLKQGAWATKFDSLMKEMNDAVK